MDAIRPVDTSPAFIIAGVMKGATTSLHRWLEAQPEVWMPGPKEPNFFASDEQWAMGAQHYWELFAKAPPDKLTGEASVAYSFPALSERAATRIATTLPGIRLIFVLRHPVARARSHYRHEVQRSRERRSFAEAIGDPSNQYTARSMYHACLAPYLERFAPQQLCLITTESLVSPLSPGWSQVLDHLGLPRRTRPTEAYNITANKMPFNRPAEVLWRKGLLQRADRLPAPIRRLGRQVLSPNRRSYESLAGSAEIAIPPGSFDAVRADLHQLIERVRDRELSSELVSWASEPW